MSFILSDSQPCGVQRPGNVVPEHVDLSVVGQQFANLPVNIVDKPLARLLVGGAARAIGMVPVHQRIVESDAQAFGARRIHVFAHQIASRALLGRAVIRSACVSKWQNPS